MSYVTNVMLGMSISEQSDTIMAAVNTWLREHARGQQMADLTDGGGWGGHKYPEVALYAAAFNYLDLEPLLRMLGSLAWAEPRYVQVFVCDQDDDAFSVFMLRDGKMRKVLDGSVG